jgi:hypothetical protein
MIKLTTITSSGYITHYVAPDNVARITEAGTSSQWHGIRSYVRLFDGDTLECSETVDHINRMINDE